MARLALTIAAELLALAAIGLFVLMISAVLQPASPATGCDAAMRIIAADRERARREYERLCLEALGLPDNPFAKIACEAPR
jgi:hypothetical protein